MASSAPVIREILKHGADPTVLVREMTTLAYIISRESPAAAMALIEDGRSINIPAGGQNYELRDKLVADEMLTETPLMIAAKQSDD